MLWDRFFTLAIDLSPFEPQSAFLAGSFVTWTPNKHTKKNAVCGDLTRLYNDLASQNSLIQKIALEIYLHTLLFWWHKRDCCCVCGETTPGWPLHPFFSILDARGSYFGIKCPDIGANSLLSMPTQSVRLSSCWGWHCRCLQYIQLVLGMQSSTC